MTITSSGKNIAGEKFNLTCTAVIDGSPEVPNISWNSASTISAEEALELSYDNGTYISVLQFDPLQESHGDHYQCLVMIADIVEEELFNLTVQGYDYHTISDINFDHNIP